MNISRIVGVACFGLLAVPLLFVHAQEIDGQYVARLRKQLRDADELVRVQAARDLGGLHGVASSAIGDLIEILEKDNVPDVRIAAGAALAAIHIRFKPKEAAPIEKRTIVALVRSMQQDKDTVVRWNSCYVFRTIGPQGQDAARALVKLIEDKDDGRMRELACDSLGEVVTRDSKEIVAALLKIYKEEPDESRHVKGTCLVVLGKIGDKEDLVIPLLVEALKDPNKVELRSGAAGGIVYLGPRAKAAVPALAEALDVRMFKDEARAHAVQYCVIQALESMGPDARRAIPALRKVAQTKLQGYSNQRFALQVLRSLEN